MKLRQHPPSPFYALACSSAVIFTVCFLTSINDRLEEADKNIIRYQTIPRRERFKLNNPPITDLAALGKTNVPFTISALSLFVLAKSFKSSAY